VLWAAVYLSFQGTGLIVPLVFSIGQFWVVIYLLGCLLCCDLFARLFAML